jgi:ankyrin repeat protein
VQLLLDKGGAEVNFSVEDHDGPLRLAAYWGHKEIVQLLLAKGANIFTPGSGSASRNALHDACLRGYMDIVQLLLENADNIHLPSEYYGRVLLTAVELSHKEIVLLLLEKGSDVGFLERDYASALEVATNREHIEIVQLLLERGVSVPEDGSVLRD